LRTLAEIERDLVFANNNALMCEFDLETAEENLEMANEKVRELNREQAKTADLSPPAWLEEGPVPTLLRSEWKEQP
jgi:hypothetical protein